MNEVYERLARYLDDLPAGYPRTESGVELRILHKMFSPEEAKLFMHLTLLPEEPRTIAYRANQPVQAVSQRLDEMEKKGLIFGSHKPGMKPEYSAMQFVVGFWEGQVNRLDRELVELVEEYLPQFIDLELWRKAPQLRTIPVGESISVQTGVLPYEQAGEIVRSQSAIAVANCICRQEMHISGEGCSKPSETCMSFGSAAHSWANTGRGRMISTDEALQILELADQAGLVLQPSNAKEPSFICACCGCCCGVLRNIKLHPQPARIASSPYQAVLDRDVCSGCGTCLDRCQMDAITLPDGSAELNEERCIGCGLCVTTCTTGALTLERKPETEQPFIPKDMVGASLQLGQARGKLGKRELVGMLAKSKIDRIKARGAEA